MRSPLPPASARPSAIHNPRPRPPPAPVTTKTFPVRSKLENGRPPACSCFPAFWCWKRTPVRCSGAVVRGSSRAAAGAANIRRASIPVRIDAAIEFSVCERKFKEEERSGVYEGRCLVLDQIPACDTNFEPLTQVKPPGEDMRWPRAPCSCDLPASALTCQ